MDAFSRGLHPWLHACTPSGSSQRSAVPPRPARPGMNLAPPIVVITTDKRRQDMTARFRRLPQILAGMALAILTAVPPSLAQAAPPTVTVRPPMLLGGVTASRTHIVFSWA